jgi:hypothetical protein
LYIRIYRNANAFLEPCVQRSAEVTQLDRRASAFGPLAVNGQKELIAAKRPLEI